MSDVVFLAAGNALRNGIMRDIGPATLEGYDSAGTLLAVWPEIEVNGTGDPATTYAVGIVAAAGGETVHAVAAGTLWSAKVISQVDPTRWIGYRCGVAGSGKPLIFDALAVEVGDPVTFQGGTQPWGNHV